ncbi:hypothetical protein E2C01_031895 [Portunus trituberculatus]|uniref:Uncharacterized protein n=1 Tax=Portunus trituberculatus TaxID=210409 RepID=A0A5B7EZE3_PORTR|nr:hypothetical protein [Portunus trituberculatus]
MDVEREQGSVLPHHLSLTLPQSLMTQAVHEEAQCRSLKEPMPCSANLRLSKDWYGWARSLYLPDRASLTPPVNEVGNPAVFISSRLLVQMEKVCGRIFWKFLSALDKANKDILHPAKELRFRLLLMLRRQAVVDSLPCTFSDREKCPLLSSLSSDMLFDPAVVARVHDNEHLASQ